MDQPMVFAFFHLDGASVDIAELRCGENLLRGAHGGNVAFVKQAQGVSVHGGEV